jgi:hypothetical protein
MSQWNLSIKLIHANEKCKKKIKVLIINAYHEDKIM